MIDRSPDYEIVEDGDGWVVVQRAHQDSLGRGRVPVWVQVARTLDLHDALDIRDALTEHVGARMEADDDD